MKPTPRNLDLHRLTPEGEHAGAVDRVDVVQKTLEANNELRLQRAKNTAAQQLIIHRGADETVDLIGHARNPVDAGGAIPTEIVVTSLLVPAGKVFRLDRLGITYSDPMVAMSRCVGWRMIVNGARVPYVLNTSEDYNYSAFGDVAHPIEIAPAWVQAGGTIAIAIYPRFGFNLQLTVTARMSGRLFKPASGEVTA